MYQEVYQEMVKCGITSKLDKGVWFNEAGNIVEEEKDAFGLNIQYFPLHPNKVIFVDKDRNSTSQANDGNVRGEKFYALPVVGQTKEQRQRQKQYKSSK
jgi:hypothetical protein